MSAGTLWTVPQQPQGKYVRFLATSIAINIEVLRQIRAAAAFGDLSIDVPENYKHFEDNKKPEFLSKFPHGKIPAFEGKDGFLLSESYAIGRYGESSFCSFRRI